jgi:hypothetical protein
MMNSTIERLEAAVLEMLLRGDHPLLGVLRSQPASASVSSRELTGWSFFTKFEVPPSAPRSTPPKFQVGDVEATVPGRELPLGLVVFIDDGRLLMLEGHTYGEAPWPETLDTFTLRYEREPRSLEHLGGGST